jgi:hypothetical protein
MEKLRLLEVKRKARIETSLKRKQLQIKSINEEYECQMKELEASYVLSLVFFFFTKLTLYQNDLGL